MNKANLNLALRLIVLVATSALAGIFIAQEKYWTLLFMIILICLGVLSLFRFYRYTTKETRRFINAIRFFEGNVLFDSSVSKGLDPELSDEMRKAIGVFSDRIQKSQADRGFFDILLHFLDFPIIVSDDEGNVAWANKAMADISGTTRLKHLSDLRAVSAELPDIVRELKSPDVKTVKIHRAQKEHHLAVTVSHAVIKEQNFNIYNFKNIQPIVDETEGDAWQKLIRVLAHEIMNSIAPIVSLAETFGDEELSHDPEMMQKAMETILRRCRGLMEFVDNYRSLTRIPPPDLREFRAADMVEDISNLLESQNISFSLSVHPQNLTLTGDRAQLEQVLINLIKNGYEASVEKGSPEVSLSVRRDSSMHTVFTVSDNGEGIIPEVADKIFIPFFTTKKNGSGIGLNICRQIVTAHRGTIAVMSEPGKGTKFVIKL